MSKNKLKILGLVFVSLTILSGYLAYYIFKKPALDIDNVNYLVLSPNDNVESLAKRLEHEFGLSSPTLFVKIAERMNLQSSMKKGRYTLDPKMSIIDLVRVFREGRKKTVDMVIPPAISLEKFAMRCGDKLEADTIDFMNILNDSAFLDSLGFSPATVYALILPDKYNLLWHTQADEMMMRMKLEYEKFWNGERMQKLQKTGLSKLEVSILASIVSKETNKTDEMPSIAGMYINRLRLGMPLQADPTVKFALDSPALKRILNGHLQVESPYNTYKYKGLPPGPICIAGKTSIDAVLNFVESDYLFMCAKEDFSGYHNFASNYEEHLKNAGRYRRALDEKGIK